MYQYCLFLDWSSREKAFLQENDQDEVYVIFIRHESILVATLKTPSRKLKKLMFLGVVSIYNQF